MANPFPEFVVKNQELLKLEDGAAGAAKPVELDVKVESSDLPDWCWAAISLGVLKGYKNASKAKQCQVVNALHKQESQDDQLVCCKEGRTHKREDCNATHLLRTALIPHHAQALLGDDTDSQRFDLIRKQIDDGRPVAVRVQFSDLSNKGHYVLVSGYKLPDTLLVWDPDENLDKPKEVPVEELNKQYRGSGKWDETHLTQGAAGTQTQVARKKK